MSELSRRDFIKASAAAVVVAALPVVPALAEPNFTVRYQSWPFQSTRPEMYVSGQCSWERFKLMRVALEHIYESPMYWARVPAKAGE